MHDSETIKASVCVISLSLRLWQITQTSALVILAIMLNAQPHPIIIVNNFIIFDQWGYKVNKRIKGTVQSCASHEHVTFDSLLSKYFSSTSLASFSICFEIECGGIGEREI